MVCDKHAKEEFILSTVRQPRPPWHCDANREDHMTELDHEALKGLCCKVVGLITIHEIFFRILKSFSRMRMASEARHLVWLRIFVVLFITP